MKDKASVIKAAQKYISRGQIDKAIAEWEQLLDTNGDSSVFNTIGDLYLRKGDEKKAIEFFMKAAEKYRLDGFYPKAIALYKKILNIIPGQVDSLMALAGLNAERGLIGSANEFYLRAAEVYKRDGFNEKAVSVIEKILKHGVPDLNTRMKIADLYLRLGMTERAANEFVSMAGEYIEQGTLDRAEELYKKAVMFDESNIDSIVGLCRIAEAKGEAGAVDEYIKKALAASPESSAVLILAAEMSLKKGNLDEAARLIEKVISKNPSHTDAHKMMGRILLNKGNIRSAWEHVMPCVDEYIRQNRWDDAEELLQGFEDSFPAPVKERKIEICRGRKDREKLLHETKDLASLFEEAGENEQALRLYKDALDISPDDQDLIMRIQEIETSMGIAPKHEVSARDEGEEIIMPGDRLIQPDALRQEDILSAHSDAGPTEWDFSDAEAKVSEEDAGGISSDELSEKKTEAEFYARQGLYGEAIAIYEKLATVFPNDEGVAETLRNLTAHAAGSDAGKPDKKGPEEAVSDASEAKKSLHTGPEEYDCEALYNAGVDLRQKGMLDEAIESFRKAASDPEKEHLCARMLASCYMEKGVYSLAIEEFRKVLAGVPQASPVYYEIKYDLAGALMLNENQAQALQLYSEIEAENSGFRDVAAKIANLREKMAGRPIRTRPRRDRVSYI